MKKYELIETQSIQHCGVTLYRIKALIDFSDVKAGQVGGYVENEENLSQKGEAWVYGEARVYGNACVYGEARVSGDAQVYDQARVYDSAQVCWNARVYGNACVYGEARVYGKARVYDSAQVYGEARVSVDAEVYGDARVYDSAQVYWNACVYDSAQVYGEARISGNADIKNETDYILFKNNWSSGRFFTYTKSNRMWRVGCFHGTGDELVKKAYKDSQSSGDHYKLYVELVEKMEEIENG